MKKEEGEDEIRRKSGEKIKTEEEDNRERSRTKIT
jgi:hypothetical protein